MMRPTPARGRPDPSSRAAADRGVSRAQVACTTMARGRITSPFTARSTATEVVAGIDLRDKRAIVTCGSPGIGIETARALASTGADVTLAVRNPPPELASAPRSMTAPMARVSGLAIEAGRLRSAGWRTSDSESWVRLSPGRTSARVGGTSRRASRPGTTPVAQGAARL